MTQYEFKGQTAIVTGGTRGIGRAISEKLLASGAIVVAVYAGNEEEAKAFKQETSKHAENLTIKRCDVSDYEQVEALYKELEKVFPGGIEILVNNSGIRKDAVL